MRLRAVTSDDWTAILRVANEALPQAPDGNTSWLEARRSFDLSGRARHQYVGEDTSGTVIAYGAIEQEPDSTRWRLFIVMSPDRLAGTEGALLFECLLADLQAAGAQTAWAREHADDAAFASFVAAHGFTETRRFVIDAPVAGAYRGVEVVEFELWLTP